MAKNVAETMHAFFVGSLKNNPEAFVIAKLIKRAIEARYPKTRYAAGFMAKPILIAKEILPNKLTDWLLMSQLQ